MARQPARLKDIAAATGFSANTVSLALRGSERIPDETRERILAAARKLNYLPNQVAQSLVSRETKTVGLILTVDRQPDPHPGGARHRARAGRARLQPDAVGDRERHRQGDRGAQRLPLAPGRRDADLCGEPPDARPHPAARQGGLPDRASRRRPGAAARRGGGRRSARRRDRHRASRRARPSAHRLPRRRRIRSATSRNSKATGRRLATGGISVRRRAWSSIPHGHSAIEGVPGFRPRSLRPARSGGRRRCSPRTICSPSARFAPAATTAYGARRPRASSASTTSRRATMPRCR